MGALLSLKAKEVARTFRAEGTRQIPVHSNIRTMETAQRTKQAKEHSGLWASFAGEGDFHCGAEIMTSGF